MAGPDPTRRSSRARAPQSQSQQSSATSSASGHAERNTRSFNKTGSPQKSTSTASLSSEPPDDSITTADDILVRSRRTRAKEEDHDQTSTIADEIEMAHGDDLQDEDEAVRCVCGQDEYPGPPSVDDLKSATKDGYNLDSIYPTEITEDLAGFYVQCDICKVWQHGACVGLTNDDTLPEEYYCEQCRSDHHKVFTSTNGTKFSIYIPLNRPSRAPSLVKDGTRSPKSKDGKTTRLSAAAAAAASSKRRSTMNSRDAAYDEEQLRIAIEVSKGETTVDPPEGSVRRAKRGRSDSEENPENPKRPRTSSRSASPTVEKQLEGDDSDEAMATRNGSSKKARNAATRTQLERAEKEQRERQRAEAANKRKGRAERRRADDSDPLEDIPLAARAVASRITVASANDVVPTPEAPPSSQPTPDTPPASTVTTNNSRSKGGRPTHKKKGRNQYTKDRDGREEDSPARSQSRDVQEAAHSTNSKPVSENTKSNPRSRGGMNSKVSLSEMRRRVTAMFDYISKTQVELAGETATGTSLASRRSSKETNQPSSLPLITLNGGSSAKKLPSEKSSATTQNGDATNAAQQFKELSCVEMMDFLTRDLVHWQNQFAG